MSVVTKNNSIPKNVSSNDDLSFDFLRKKGIEYIESFGTTFWTDYNTHDPGITILEVLCYAITDLGMRINLPIEDLLSNSTNNTIENQFFKASEILPNKAVTAFDYRKIVLDINPLLIKNCWLQKHSKTIYINCKEAKISYHKEDFEGVSEDFIKETTIKGLYTFLVDIDEEDESVKSTIKQQILEKFHTNRNLCEDIAEIKEVEIQPIAVCTQIEIDPEADEEYVQALIVLALENYLSPSITFYSLSQMIEKGYTSDVIFEGPLLDNGFIDTAELANSSLRTDVRLSDIMQIIMNIDGVKLIKDISINYCNQIDENVKEWVLCIDEGKKPQLCHKSTFSFTKGVLPVNVNKAKVTQYINELKKDIVLKQKEATKDKELTIPKGRITETNFYTSITNDFPETYGIGAIGLSDVATPQRKAKAKQLKGYLLFFDQILASYFKHLSNVKQLLSINNPLTKTYFTQVVSDIEGFEELVSDYDADSDVLSETLFGHLDDAVKRNNNLKDHLIARFAERFSEYAFLMKSLYGSVSDEIVLRNKADFLNSYNATSSHRGCGFNYYKQPVSHLWNTFNVTGLENRIAGLLGIKGDSNPLTGKRGIKRKNISNLFIQIYDPTPLTPADNFRWRIKNASNQIILSATDDYATETEAANEMYFAILKILETSETEIKEGFTSNFTHKVIHTFEIHQAESGKFSFHIINPEIETVSDPDRIIAKQYKFYDTLEEVKTAILELITFFKEEFTEEGIFLVEHILLLPKDDEMTTQNHFMPICIDDCNETCCIPDPYSFKISVVLPGYTYRFSNIDFRNYAEDVIRQEIPAHILGKICWIGYRKNHINTIDNDLLDFERDFKNFLIDKSKNKQDALPDFVHSLSKLNSIFPTGTLFNCEDENEDLTGKVILGKTNLGTI
ncbi:conserved hypothetical protein [Flavobacterium sp. 9AF]|uniref:hypothetical protein n=1 Tax=Flavobacterium sp. 9AF TaxID=2653142 RepID=UPI0012F048FC|nr:hypothetical protein [Flavobacterium sp. 9AF]VXB29956.1 conserved hypothetical protein [Flavobacterium sp. 9AF]